MQRETRLAGALLAVFAAVAIGWWLARDGATAPPAQERAEAPTAQAEQQPDAPPPAAGAAQVGAIAPTHRIGEGGRLSLDTAELPREGPLALALDLPDAARGSDPRPVRIVSQDGSRALDLVAAPLPGSGSGVALLIDPDWLRPDRYLIEVKTAEATHFPLRRYVLELR